jgi:hypothetical protein
MDVALAEEAQTGGLEALHLADKSTTSLSNCATHNCVRYVRLVLRKQGIAITVIHEVFILRFNTSACANTCWTTK